MNTPLIVVAGAAGKLGRLVIASLLQHPGVRVRALVRDPNKAEVAGLASARVELVAFDATKASESERAQAVHGAHAVISTLQGGPDIIIDAQLGLLRAAKAAGARRFFPSDYSYNFFTLPAGLNVNSDWRRQLAELAARETSPSFEVVHVLQGIFLDQYVLGFMGLFDAAQRTVRYWGEGSTPIDWTTWEDTARFTAAAALDERPVPAQLFVSGERMTLLDFVEAYHSAHGQPLTVQRLGSLDELAQEIDRRLKAEPQNMYAWLPLMYMRGVFSGKALLGSTLNGRYPELKAETVAQAMARGAV